ncbi:hypothetical protein SBRY_10874 [Actinacidiphila bryophytorum]|uniref:Uncharacterized protein n=1 Tax=Actinacidiphila bryophytorum TaxID=1436133 RepID=A0A9W4GZ14_9ACTN|nr:hypothetical protein SBRY_10874 [Actinacidiphila bryophytorum]
MALASFVEWINFCQAWYPCVGFLRMARHRRAVPE